jgi:hypothetical protein
MQRISELNELAKKDDAEILEYLRPTLVKSLQAAGVEHPEIQGAIRDFRFQVKSAYELLQDVAINHKTSTIGSFQVVTNVMLDSGLTVEEMLAITWWALQDEKNVEVLRMVNTTEEKEGVSKDLELSFINHLFQIRDGYRIDHGQHKPELHIYQESGEHESICVGGTVNKLMDTLNGVHSLAEIKVVTKDIAIASLTASLKEKLPQFFPEVLPADISFSLYQWNVSKIMPASLRVFITEAFKKDELSKAIISEFGAFFDGPGLADIINNTLDKLEIPQKLLEKSSAFDLARLSLKDKLSIVKNDALPSFILTTKGYQNKYVYIYENFIKGGEPNEQRQLVDALIESGTRAIENIIVIGEVDLLKTLLTSASPNLKMALLNQKYDSDGPYEGILPYVIKMGKNELVKVILESCSPNEVINLLSMIDEDLPWPLLIDFMLKDKVDIFKITLDSVSSEEAVNLLDKVVYNKINAFTYALFKGKHDIIKFIFKSLNEEDIFKLLVKVDEYGCAPLAHVINDEDSQPIVGYILNAAINSKFEERMRIFEGIPPEELEANPIVNAFISLHKEGKDIANIIIEVAKLQNVTPEEISENRNKLNIVLKILEGKNKALCKLVECIATDERPIKSGDARIDGLFEKAKSFIVPEESLDLKKASIAIAKIHHASSKLESSKGLSL